MKCKFCGTEIGYAGAQCPLCGRIDDSVPQEEQPSQPEQQYDYAEAGGDFNDFLDEQAAFGAEAAYEEEQRPEDAFDEADVEPGSRKRPEKKKKPAFGGKGLMAGLKKPGREKKGGENPPAAEKKPASPGRGFAMPKLDMQSIIPVLCLVLCVLCLIISVSAKSSAKKANEALEEMSAQNSALAAEISGLKGQLEQLHTAPSGGNTANGFNVVNAPSDETQTLGYVSKPDFHLFRYAVSGADVMSFVWEKQQPGGQWEPIAFDANGKSERYGLVMRMDLGAGETKLAAAGLTAEAAGAYRCTVYGMNGEQAQAVVNLNIS